MPAGRRIESSEAARRVTIRAVEDILVALFHDKKEARNRAEIWWKKHGALMFEDMTQRGR